MNNINLKNKTIPIIIGPTGVGKTALSIKLAQNFDAEIISADSKQMVREMNIGTAKPTNDELQLIKHHFIDNISPQNEIYSSYTYGVDARQKITELFSQNKTPLIIGGSGLYIQSLVHGFFDDLCISDEAKSKFRKDIEQKPLLEAYEMLQKYDPDYAQITPATNKQRIHRALEVFILGGKKMSILQKEHKNNFFFTPLYIGLNIEREILYERINSRVKSMIEQGLVKEVEFLANKYGKELKRLNTTIGYKEVLLYLENKFSLDEMITLIAKHTRHYAKRQITWFKRLENVHWLTPNDFDKAKKYIYNNRKE